MSLKSSEIIIFLVNISAVLLSSFCSSSCHAFLPLFVRPMKTKEEMILKIIFHSQEFNRSIIVSTSTTMTKKMNQFLRHFMIGDWTFSWVNIGPNSFHNRKSSCGWAGRIPSLWFCFGPWSACKIFGIQFLRILFELKILEVPAQWCSNSSQTCLIHEKFWPKSEYCLCLWTKFWSQLHIYHASNWLQLSIRAQFWCSLGSILMVVMLLLLLEECIHDRPLH